MEVRLAVGGQHCHNPPLVSPRAFTRPARRPPEPRPPTRHNMFTVSNPERLVIDLEDVELGNILNDLTKLVGDDDPYIKSIRVGRFKPGVVRLVLDLKNEVKPQLFALKPVGEYGYRLFLGGSVAPPPQPLFPRTFQNCAPAR